MTKSDTDISFSVVIPVYNGSTTLVRAINSVLNQTYAPLEIIVADDASTDNTVALIQEQFLGRVILLCSSMNRGSAAARNRGIEAARGTYIAFLDADDEWHPDKLKYCVLALQQLPSVSLLYHSYRLYSETQDALHMPVVVQPLSTLRLLKGNCIVTSCAVMQADARFRFDENMRYTEDYDLWLRIVHLGKVYAIPHMLTMLHRPVTSEGGISSNIWAMRVGEMKAYTHLIRQNIAWIAVLPFLWLYSIMKHFMRGAGVLKKGVSYTKQ